MLLIVAYRQGKLNPQRPIAFLILIYAILTAITPFVQPRYNYFVYVLLALELARKEAPEEQLEITKAGARSPGFLPPAHPERIGSY